MNKTNSIKFLSSLLVIILVLLRISNKKVALIVFVFGFVMFIIKHLPFEVDKFLHTKIIKLPNALKCKIDINCKSKGCSSDLIDDHESQINADVDFYTLGHILMWALITKAEPRLTIFIVFMISVVWEIIEIYAGCNGFAMHGRLTDILFNSLGFFIGKIIL